MTDIELLTEYVHHGSQEAFSELVGRHTDWIYSMATRLVRDPGLADDVAQAVFIVLSQKASTLLRSRSLNRWLFQVTHYSAKRALRTEARLRRRQTSAVALAAATRRGGAESPADSMEEWDKIVAHLDDATARLGGTDRQAVLLRFYQRKTLAQVGDAMGVSEEAAKKRVARAVDHLRNILSAKGVAPSAVAFAILLLDKTTRAAPISFNAAVISAGSQLPPRLAEISTGAIQGMLMKTIFHLAAWAATAIVLIGLIAAGVIVMTKSAPATPAVAAPGIAATSQSLESPYVQAIQLVKQLAKTPDAPRINADAPLDAATGSFLDRNQPIFELLHAGALTKTTDWGAGSDNDIQKILNQLNSVRSLAALEVLRARWRWSRHDESGAQDDFLDAIAFDRNIARGNSILIVKLVQITIESLVLHHWAVLLPSTPAPLLAQLPDRLKQLPNSGGMTEVIRAEQRYAAGQTNIPPEIVKGMSPFYDTVIQSLDQNPAPSPAQFQNDLDSAVAKIDAKSDPAGQSIAEVLIPSLARAYLSVAVGEAQFEMFKTAVAIVRDGESAVSASVDPFGKGPFEYTQKLRGFELRSKLLDRNRKQVTMDFGS